MWSIFARKKILEKVVRVTIKENQQEPKITVKVIGNITCKYPDTKDYAEENLREVCEGEGLVAEEVIYFFVYLCSLYSCLWVFKQINGIIFHTSAILF